MSFQSSTSNLFNPFKKNLRKSWSTIVVPHSYQTNISRFFTRWCPIPCIRLGMPNRHRQWLGRIPYLSNFHFPFAESFLWEPSVSRRGLDVSHPKTLILSRTMLIPKSILVRARMAELDGWAIVRWMDQVVSPFPTISLPGLSMPWYTKIKPTFKFSALVMKLPLLILPG